MIDTGGIAITVGLEVTELSVLTAMLVGVVALAVQVYSVGYMRGEARYPSFSAFISLFTSAMLLVVFAARPHRSLYVGWEIMGAVLLPPGGALVGGAGQLRAAIKAFLVTRLGDVGFLFGIFVLGFAAGSFRISAHPGRSTSPPRPWSWRRCCCWRGGGQERPGPAAHLAARRDGRPDADQRPDPRRDDGGGRHLRGGPPLRAVPGSRPSTCSAWSRRSACSARRWRPSPRAT